VISAQDNIAASYIYSSYLGGMGRDAGTDIKVDDLQNIYIAGETQSLDFPVTANCFQPHYKGGGSDGFVTKLNLSFNLFGYSANMVFSTYIGGNGEDKVLSWTWMMKGTSIWLVIRPALPISP
jgi:hypothetical protein